MQEKLFTATRSARRSWPGLGQLLDQNFRYVALVPALLVLIVLTLIPALQLVRMAFSDVRLVPGGTEWTFVGLTHLWRLISDPMTIIVLKNTALFTVIVAPTQVFLGLVLAYVVSRVRYGTTFYRTVIILPLLLPPVAIGALWRLMYDHHHGMINQLLAEVGIAGPLWLASPDLALYSLIIVDIWHWTSFTFLIFLAGVQGIPNELIEAAEVDGASSLQVFRHVVLPLLKRTIVVALMLRTILAFKVFDVPYLLTGGGPGTATEMINIYIQQVYFQQFRLGYGAMLALVAAVILSLFIVVYLRLTSRPKVA